MSKVAFIMAFLTFYLSSIESLSGQNRIEIYYTGNMGICVSLGEAEYLIDALHDYHGPDYLFPDEVLLKQMLGRIAPFDSVSKLINTHVHRDHFDSKLVAEYLRSNPSVKFLAPQQVIDTLVRDVTDLDPIRNQVISFTDASHVEHYDEVTGFPIRHTFQQRHHWVENYGVVIEVGETSIVHLGDAEASVEALQEVPYFQNGVDVVIAPFWFLLSDDDTQLLVDYFRPRWILATHISPLIDQEMLTSIRQAYPQTILCTEPGLVLKLAK